MKIATRPLPGGHARAATHRARQLVHGRLVGEAGALVDKRAQTVHSAADIRVVHLCERGRRYAEHSGKNLA
jgi:hypothetical protein